MTGLRKNFRLVAQAPDYAYPAVTGKSHGAKQWIGCTGFEKDGTWTDVKFAAFCWMPKRRQSPCFNLFICSFCAPLLWGVWPSFTPFVKILILFPGCTRCLLCRWWYWDAYASFPLWKSTLPRSTTKIHPQFISRYGHGVENSLQHFLVPFCCSVSIAMACN